ncbi:unnamed protein product [Clonostachys rosea f. rosea IK726]|uniref:Uncharacterized protein n=1 Tax=Clonostachys rosea f. rosea IK726 TaxID=1349383 RepID=A0ACA9UR79_BIOOC|nr:unnamed protein product [Clonostachys rosea f. rosea IK726]
MDVWRGKEEKGGTHAPQPRSVAISTILADPRCRCFNVAFRQAGGTVRYDTSAGWCVARLVIALPFNPGSCFGR